MSEFFCEKHNMKKELMAGRNAHWSNWYCPMCDSEKDSPSHRAGLVPEKPTKPYPPTPIDGLGDSTQPTVNSDFK